MSTKTPFATGSGRIPAEFSGRARMFRRNCAGSAGASALVALTREFRGRLNNRSALSRRDAARLLRAMEQAPFLTRDVPTPAQTESFAWSRPPLEFGGLLVGESTFVDPTWEREPGYFAEPGVQLRVWSATIHPARLDHWTAPIVTLSLHALARLYQRARPAFTIDDRAVRGVLAELGRNVQATDLSAEERPVSIATEAGTFLGRSGLCDVLFGERLVGEGGEILTMPLVSIRTFVDPDLVADLPASDPHRAAAAAIFGEAA